MCGILGWISPNQSLDFERFGRSLDLLTHRGPDDRGVWDGPGILLGHRRLSIVDLSVAGHQPMVEPASGAVIIFNGEIYNHLELRKELESLGHRFAGHSDTEVLLHALIEWGVAALPRLNGMWAFAFWQPTLRRLLMARDRFGVKPLYYRSGGQGFAFSSEPKSLLDLFPEHRQASDSVMIDFLANNLLYAGGESFYRGINVFPPAHYGVYELGADQMRLERYWNYPQCIDDELVSEDAVAQFDELFTDAVRLRLRSDVTVGLTLSGGLDSTGVLAAACRLSSNPPTSFTSIYSEGEAGELPWAQRAIEGTHSPLITVPAPQAEWLATLRKIAWHMDGPGYSPAVYPLWHLMQRARMEGVPVLLEGQGADEALAGYPQYSVLELLSYLKGASGCRPSLAGLIARVSALRRTFSLPWALAWAARESSPALLAWHRRRVGFESFMRDGLDIPGGADSGSEKTADPVRQRLITDHSITILPGLLHYGDAISMAHSIEARHPFMDYRLVEWMFRLPTRLKFEGSETKWVLREYLRGNGQQTIGNRPDKKGYPTPVGKWLASKDGKEIERLILDKQSQLYEWCDLAKVRRLIERQRQGAMASEHHLYKLLSTKQWLEECLNG